MHHPCNAIVLTFVMVNSDDEQFTAIPKSQVLANRANDVLQHARKKERDVVVGYGAAKFACTGRGERAVPTTGTNSTLYAPFVKCVVTSMDAW